MTTHNLGKNLAGFEHRTFLVEFGLRKILSCLDLENILRFQNLEKFWMIFRLRKILVWTLKIFQLS